MSGTADPAPGEAATRVREIWFHALGARVGGGVTYLRHVAPRLAGALGARGVRLVLLASPGTEVPPLPDAVEVRTVQGADAMAGRLRFDQATLPRMLRARTGAVLYASGNFAPVRPGVPSTVLLRNAVYFADDYLRRERVLRRAERGAQRLLVLAGARAAGRVHYPTESMRALVEAAAPDLRDRGLVNLYGVDPALLARSAAAAAPRRRPGPPTFLHVLTYTLQKNVGLVLRALVEAEARGVPARVIATARLEDAPRTVAREHRALVEDHDLVGRGRIRFVGATRGEDLLRLYDEADACLFPSLCESFGHPAVEALALRKPLVAADLPWAREIAGPHAAYVAPDRPSDLVDLWARWDEVAAALPRADPDALATRFSWDDHAERLAADLASGP